MRPDTARTNERLQIAPRRRGLWPMGRATCPRRLRPPRFPPRPLSVVAVWNGLFSLPIGYQD